MFAKPRVKKSLLLPPNKKRKTNPTIEEISFDNTARQEYLTGFHKRKLQRIKNSQEEADKRARLEKIEARKQLRDERKQQVEEHVETVNRLLRESGAVTDLISDSGSEAEDEEWGGLPDPTDLDLVDDEEEYIDEDRYTTVTVESVTVSRDGLSKPKLEEIVEKKEAGDGAEEAEAAKKKTYPPKKKKKKFRYETKMERQLANSKARAKKAKRRE